MRTPEPTPDLAEQPDRSPFHTFFYRDEVWGRWLLARLGRLPGVRIPAKNLALLGQGPGRFMLIKTALAALGLLCPVLVTIPWIIAGVSLPFYVPAVVGLAAAGLLFITPDLAVRDQAKRAREEFAHAVAAYLDPVALKRAADAGPAEALEKAAAVGRGWPFLYLQGALRRARLEKIPPWQALTDLKDEYDLPVLDDVADIARLGDRRRRRLPGPQGPYQSSEHRAACRAGRRGECRQREDDRARRPARRPGHAPDGVSRSDPHAHRLT